MVEWGVWKGGAAGMMALAHLHRDAAATRELHLFDSWEGLPEPQEMDGKLALEYAAGHGSGALRPIGQCVSALSEVSDLLEARIGYPARLLHYHKGWFQETVARDRDAMGEIALLRLDG